MKRILFLINTLVCGGAENVLVNIVNNIDNSKYEVTVQTISDGGEYEKRLNPDIKYKTLIKNKNKYYKRIMAYILLKLIPAKIVYQRFIHNDYDIEVAFLEGFPTKILSESRNPEKYAWVHTDLYNYYGQKKVFRTIEENANCYRKYKKIICVSDCAKQGFKKRIGFDDNVEVLHNPIDDEAILEKSVEIIEEMNVSNNFKIITVGRLVYQKGYDRLLRVHKRLIDEGFNYELWIIGEGNKRKELETYINENKLNGSVKLLGYQSNPYKFMKEADLFVCSSRVEGFSSAVMEALILGIPIVTTDCAGMKEQLGESKWGLIVENSMDGLYNGIISMLNDKEKLKCYAEKAQIRGKQLSIYDSINKIEEIFQ